MMMVMASGRMVATVVDHVTMEMLDCIHMTQMLKMVHMACALHVIRMTVVVYMASLFNKTEVMINVAMQMTTITIVCGVATSRFTRYARCGSRSDSRPCATKI